MKKVYHNKSRKFFAGILACVLLISGLTGCRGKKAEQDDFALVTIATEAAQQVQETEAAKKEMSVTDLLKAVTTLKDDLETALEALKNNELDVAREKTEGLGGKTDVIRSSVAVTLENLGDSAPSLQKELVNVQNLLNLADQLAETILMPSIEMMENFSSEQVQEEGSVRTKMICEYLDFAESLMPELEALLASASTVDMSLVDSDGDIENYLMTAEDLLEGYRKNPAVLSAIKAIFGDGEDRSYLVAAQGSAEIRASGGFPGAMGVLRIQNGGLVLQDFKRVYDLLSSYTPEEANITVKENQLFHYGLHAPRDADYCPDFERVAYIWALGYKAGQGEAVDGVISMTPAFVQRMLAAMDEEIKLFDGTIINGDNAVRVLQHDLYFKYFGPGYVEANKVVSDQLFADAAKKTMQKFQENMEISDLTAYLEVVKECIADRTLLLWMADEEEQAVIKQMGWHGGLNEDPQKPEAGVYYSCTDASKMGWFLNMDTQMGEGEKNEDGSYTYPITVVLSNVITEEERTTAQRYILGRNGGAIHGNVYFFAPAGGSISDISIDNGIRIAEDTYHDLQLFYTDDFNIRAGQPVTVTYNVTTAPGAETPLVFSKTPTVQEYH